MKYAAAAAGVIVTALAGATAADASGCAPGSSCYRKVTTPAVYGTYSRSVLVRPAQTSFSKIPAQYATATENIVVRPAQQIPIHHPAITQTVSEKVMVQPASKVWSVTRDAHGNEVGCWVEKPAVYAVQQRTVVVQPATTSYKTIPAEYGTIQRQVVVSPERLVAHTTPPVYATQTYQAQIAPATASWQPVGGHGHRHAHHGYAQPAAYGYGEPSAAGYAAPGYAPRYGHGYRAPYARTARVGMGHAPVRHARPHMSNRQHMQHRAAHTAHAGGHRHATAAAKPAARKR